MGRLSDMYFRGQQLEMQRQNVKSERELRDIQVRRANEELARSQRGINPKSLEMALDPDGLDSDVSNAMADIYASDPDLLRTIVQQRESLVRVRDTNELKEQLAQDRHDQARYMQSERITAQRERDADRFANQQQMAQLISTLTEGRQEKERGFKRETQKRGARENMAKFREGERLKQEHFDTKTEPVLVEKWAKQFSAILGGKGGNKPGKGTLKIRSHAVEAARELARLVRAGVPEEQAAARIQQDYDIHFGRDVGKAQRRMQESGRRPLTPETFGVKSGADPLGETEENAILEVLMDQIDAGKPIDPRRVLVEAGISDPAYLPEVQRIYDMIPEEDEEPEE